MRILGRIFVLVLATCFLLVVIATTTAIFRAVFDGKTPSGGRVAVLDVSGIILDSREGLEQLDAMLKDDGVKAIVVRVNSPGGLVAPSQEIFNALVKADEKKPVVVSMASLAASGGYYIALGGRKIFANSGTLTASIGVIMEFVDSSRLYDWAKMDRYTLKAGKFKDIGSSLRKMTPEERTIMQTLLDTIHTEFRETVKKRRGITDEVLNVTTDGRILTGLQAKDLKLVDELGGMQEAVKEAKTLAGLPEDAFVEYQEEEKGLLKELLWGDSSSSLAELLGKVEPILKHPLTPGYKILMLAPLSY